MLTVAEARARIVSSFAPLPAEQVSIANALGRVLAEPIHARLTQPPFAVSAMDGYAVRAADVARVPVTLKIAGYAPAGSSYAHALKSGEAVRIFTGAPLPDGADAIVIQEDTEAAGDSVLVKEGAPAGRYVRPAGLDFKQGDLGLAAGKRLGARDIGLAAAMNHPWLQVRRRPRVAILATGDEIVMPGEPVGPQQIISSNGLALAAFLSAAGAEPIDLGVAADNRDALKRLAAGAAGADLLVTTGGASVGDHDLVKAVLGEQGMTVDFWKIAIRPGKPLMFGNIGATKVIGLPGNPVSTLVCSLVFIRPALRAMLGQEPFVTGEETALTGRDLPENDSREDYLRSTLSHDEQGRLVATPFGKQDSSMQFLMQQAQCLVIRSVRAPALPKGSSVRILRLDDGL